MNKLINNNEEAEIFKLHLRAYQTQIRNGIRLIRFYVFLLMTVWVLIDALFGWVLFTNMQILNSLIVFLFFQIGILIFYLGFIKIYQNCRENINKRVNLFFDFEPIYGMYYDYWRKIKQQTEINLNLSKMVVNNISGFHKSLKTSFITINDGTVFNEEILNINSLIFFNDSWKITYYTTNKNSLFSFMFYPLLRGRSRIANKALKKVWINSDIQQAYMKRFKNAKLRKFKSASFINFKFPNRKKWTIVKNQFSRGDLEYLARRGIYVAVSDNDINFCFLESTKMPIKPGISIFNKANKFVKNNLANDDNINNEIQSIYDKAIFDLQLFLTKYLLVLWFVQKYWVTQENETLNVIEALKDELNIDF